jgi:hypothetical protein
MGGGAAMNNLNMLQDMLHTEMMNESMYNMNMMEIQNPEVRQMFMQMRDGKVQQITQLQQEIQKAMQAQ